MAVEWQQKGWKLSIKNSLSTLGLLSFLFVYTIFHKIWDAFSHYFFTYFFWTFMSLTSFLDSLYMYVEIYDSILQIFEALFIFLHLFLLSSLVNFYSSVFRFTNYFFNYLTSAELSSDFFILIIMVFTVSVIEQRQPNIVEKLWSEALWIQAYRPPFNSYVTLDNLPGSSLPWNHHL